jgi:hypothetical protein
MLLTRRLHVLLDESRWHRLETEADRRGVAMAVLVREAIDATYPAGDDDRRAAFEDIRLAEPMAVPEPDELRRELDEVRGGGW